LKIARLETYPVTDGGRAYLFVTVETDSGLVGIGEAALMGRELAIVGAIDHLRPLLIDQDPTRIEHLWQVMFRGGFFPGGRVLTSAVSAIDIALWDLLAKRFGVPLHRLLGGRVRDRVVCYPHAQVANEGRDIAGLVESCRRYVADGWKFVRWNVPQDIDPSTGDAVLEPARAVRTAVEQLGAVRSAVGDDVELCLDVHTRLDLPDAVRLCRESEPYRPFFIEDPLRAENLTQYRRLRQQTAVPLAAGEQFSGKWEFRQLVEEDLIDYCRADVCVVGGITETRKIAGWCETHGIRLALHNPIGPVSSAVCLQLNLATSNFGVQEQPRLPGASMNDIFPRQIPWRDGYLWPTEIPGLGIDFDREAARARARDFVLVEPPHLRRLDGSFANW
jgi:galactonate dehydratase